VFSISNGDNLEQALCRDYRLQRISRIERLRTGACDYERSTGVAFLSFTQYTNNTNALRDPLKRRNHQQCADRVLQQATKPPLLGLAVHPTFALEDENEESQDLHQNMQNTRTTSVSRFSLVQYAFTTIVYTESCDGDLGVVHDLDVEHVHEPYHSCHGRTRS
jgi:hypothetical protein